MESITFKVSSCQQVSFLDTELNYERYFGKHHSECEYKWIVMIGGRFVGYTNAEPTIQLANAWLKGEASIEDWVHPYSGIPISMLNS
jgi:hypothetical protein